MRQLSEDLSTNGAGPAIEDWLPVPAYIITGVLVFIWLDRDVLGFLGSLGWGCAAGQVASFVLPRAWVRIREAGFLRGAMRLLGASDRFVANASRVQAVKRNPPDEA